MSVFSAVIVVVVIVIVVVEVVVVAAAVTTNTPVIVVAYKACKRITCRKFLRRWVYTMSNDRVHLIDLRRCLPGKSICIGLNYKYWLEITPKNYMHESQATFFIT